MKLIVGLGNPGEEYQNTRHNAGFMAIDNYIDGSNFKKKDNYMIVEKVINGEKVLFVKPLTYMNNSGECIRAVMDYYKAGTDDLIVIYDDISLAPGKLRLRPKGSAGGHNGIKSIIAHLGTEQFNRIKFGVGDKPKGWDLVDWVLGRFNAEDKEILEQGRDKACEAVVCIMNEGIESGMNKYNG